MLGVFGPNDEIDATERTWAERLRSPFQIGLRVVEMVAFACTAFPLRLKSNRFYAKTVRCAKNVRYGPLERNVLDVYSPALPNPAEFAASGRRPLPVVLFVHGGAWASGCKDDYALGGRLFLRNGIVGVLINYTLFPDARCTDMIRDVSRALSWTFRHIEGYGGDPSRIFLCGHSSGAHIGLLALMYKTLSERGGAPPYTPARIARHVAAGVEAAACDKYRAADVRGFIGMSGPYHILEHYRWEAGRGVSEVSSMKPCMGATHESFDAYSPTHIARALSRPGEGCPLPGGVPIYLLHGEDDKTVPLASSQRLGEALRASSQPVRVIGYEDCGHVEIILHMLEPDPYEEGEEGHDGCQGASDAAGLAGRREPRPLLDLRHIVHRDGWSVAGGIAAAAAPPPRRPRNFVHRLARL